MCHLARLRGNRYVLRTEHNAIMSVRTVSGVNRKYLNGPDISGQRYAAPLRVSSLIPEQRREGGGRRLIRTVEPRI